MATYQSYTAIGQREDLSDVIANISPTDTPFMSSVGKTKATAVYHEWQTDSLAAAALGGAVEGALVLWKLWTKQVASLKKPTSWLKPRLKSSETSSCLC